MTATSPSTPPVSIFGQQLPVVAMLDEVASAVGASEVEVTEVAQWNPTTEEVAELFTQYRPYVGKIARRILGASGDIEDVIQDVFVTTVQNVHSVKDPERLKGWLATVTTRTARRKRFRITADNQSSPDDEDELSRICAEGPSPESTAHLAGRIQHLLDIPDQLRIPWMMRHVEGKTLETIAAECDCSLSTAQRRIRTVDGRMTIPPSVRYPIIR